MKINIFSQLNSSYSCCLVEQRHFALGNSLFEICWFYIGIAQIVLDPLPPSVKRANVEKTAACQA